MQFKEQEAQLLEALDESSIRDTDANELKMQLCVTQAIRAEQNLLMDADAIVDMMSKNNMLEVPEEEESDV